MWHEIGTATLETLYMVLVSSLFSICLGGPLGICLYITKDKGLWPHPILFQCISVLVNIFRSIPFIILLALLIPVTRFIVGTSIGSTATIVPLTIGAIPFFARILENVFFQLPLGLIEAGRAMGAKPRYIILHMLMPDALPAIINGITVTMVTLISYSAMAGAVGGGGLGALAIDYGYQRFDFTVLLITVVILVLMVQMTQYVGDTLSKRLDH